MAVMDESMYDAVLRMLEARKGEWRVISDESGVPYSTLCKVAQGWIENPSVHSVQRLYDYLLAAEKAAWAKPTVVRSAIGR
jgi:predicted transcriptional regulator